MYWKRKPWIFILYEYDAVALATQKSFLHWKVIRMFWSRVEFSVNHEMAQAKRLNLRMQKEIKLLLDDPPHGVSLNLSEDENVLSSLSSIEASMSFIFYFFWCTFNHL